MKYQPHIDGLRTLAVLPVVIFHLESSAIPGGYVGVDIFFVISGFLITSLLLEDINRGRYSLLDFYKRRILRILPALAVVLLATFFLSELIFFESQRVETGKSIVAAATFLSNFFFWGDAGYFTAPAETKPLLHTWSLAVEEQFYIFFPPLLFVMVRFARKYLLHIMAALIVASLLGCIALSLVHQPTAFYLLPPRAWELGLGAVLSVVVRNGFAQKCNRSEILGLLGLTLAIAPMFMLDSSSVFPGWNAIAPVLGATLVIGWGGAGIVGRLLSSAPFVEIGKISYSLYLWHWPVIVFWKTFSGDHLSIYDMASLFFISLFLGAVSTYVVERPFRSQRARAVSAYKVTLGGGAVLVAIAGVGALGSLNLLTLRTFPDKVQEIAATVDYPTWPDHAKQFRAGNCLIGQADGTFDAFDRAECTAFSQERPNVLLIGDSHAAQFWGALEEALPEANVMQATSSGCRFLISSAGAQRCTDLRDWVFTEYLPSHPVDLVILGGRWREDEMNLLEPTLILLKKISKQVVVIGPTVEYEGAFPELLARSELTGKNFDFETLKTAGREEINELMRRVVSVANIPYVDTLGTLCNSETCMLFAPDGVPMQFDYGHLTLSGARYVVSRNIDKLDRIETITESRKDSAK